MHHETQHGEDFRGVTESRAHRRTQVHSLAYIELSDENAGLILNISETGIAVQAVQVFTSNHFPRMRFRLPGTEIPVEAAGRLVWQVRSKKEAGIEFVGLIGTARTGIRNWIAGEPSRVAAAGKIDPLGALNLSTSPADAKPVARRHVPSTKNSDGGPKDRDTAAGSLLSARQSRSPGNDSRSATRPSSSPHDGRAAHSPSRRPVADSRAPASPTGGKWTEAPPGNGWRSAMDRPQFGGEADPSDPFLERAHVMPQWKGHVVPGVGMEYR